MSNLGDVLNEIDSDEDFDSDDSEIQREFEERIRQAQEDGKTKIFDDVSDAHSVMSMGHQTMSQMNFLPLDTDLDNLIDQMLQNPNPLHQQELERQRNERLDAVRQENLDTEALLFTEENKQNLQELKQLNQINLAEILPPVKPNIALLEPIASHREQPAEEEAKAEEELKIGGPVSIATNKVEQTKLDYVD